MEKKQTAVEWLLEQINIEANAKYNDKYWPLYKIIYDAKQMEKLQIIHSQQAAFKAGWMRANATNYDDSYFQHFLSETYGNNNH